jgi:hypothetical protein
MAINATTAKDGNQMQSSALIVQTANLKLTFHLDHSAGAGHSRHWVISFVVGTLLALLIAAGAFILLVSQR